MLNFSTIHVYLFILHIFLQVKSIIITLINKKNLTVRSRLRSVKRQNSVYLIAYYKLSIGTIYIGR